MLIRLPVICGFCTPSDGGAVAAGPRPALHCRGRAADRSHTATPPPRPRAPHSAPAGLRIPSITAAHACRGGTGSAGFPRSGSEDGWSGFRGSQVRRQSVKFILQGQGSSAEKNTVYGGDITRLSTHHTIPKSQEISDQKNNGKLKWNISSQQKFFKKVNNEHETTTKVSF